MTMTSPAFYVHDQPRSTFNTTLSICLRSLLARTTKRYIRSRASTEGSSALLREGKCRVNCASVEKDLFLRRIARARGSSIGVLDPRPFSRFHERSIGSPLTFSWRRSSAKRGTSLTFEIIRARNTHACVAMHSTTT